MCQWRQENPIAAERPSDLNSSPRDRHLRPRHIILRYLNKNLAKQLGLVVESVRVEKAVGWARAPKAYRRTSRRLNHDFVRGWFFRYRLVRWHKPGYFRRNNSAIK